MTLIRKQELIELMQILSSQRQIKLFLSRFRLLILIFIRDTIQLGYESVSFLSTTPIGALAPVVPSQTVISSLFFAYGIDLSKYTDPSYAVGRLSVPH